MTKKHSTNWTKFHSKIFCKPKPFTFLSFCENMYHHKLLQKETAEEKCLLHLNHVFGLLKHFWKTTGWFPFSPYVVRLFMNVPVQHIISHSKNSNSWLQNTFILEKQEMTFFTNGEGTPCHSNKKSSR